MLQRQPVYFRGNGRYGSGQFKRGKIVMLQRWPVYCRENGHVTEVVTLMGGKMVMLRRWPV